MCTNLKQIYNHSHDLAPGDPFLLLVPCGRCDECQINYINSWKIRSYYEALNCISKKGFVLFDTLTYRNQDLTYFNGFKCFNLSHLQKFNKKLREAINRLYGKRVKYKYLITSEFGTKYTKRPHYHVLFYVESDFIDPLRFSRLVAASWSFGRTDGLPYKSRNYVVNHNVVQDLDSIAVVSSYITKYVTKNLFLDSKLDKQIKRYMSKRFGNNWESDYQKKLYYRRLVRYFGETLKVSKHFGESLLLHYAPSQLVENHFLITNQTKVIGLPRYYQRKVCQYWTKDEEKKYHWHYNELGVRHKRYLHSKLENLNRNRLMSVKIQPTDALLRYLAIRGRIRTINPFDFDPTLYTEEKQFEFKSYCTPLDQYVNQCKQVIDLETGETINPKEFAKTYTYVSELFEQIIKPMLEKQKAESVVQLKKHIYNLHKLQTNET